MRLSFGHASIHIMLFIDTVWQYSTLFCSYVWIVSPFASNFNGCLVSIDWLASFCVAIFNRDWCETGIPAGLSEPDLMVSI